METKQILVVLYLKFGAILILRTYNFELTQSADIEVGSSTGYDNGKGLFFKALCLDDDHAVVIYYPHFKEADGSQIVLTIYKYNNGFSSIFSKEMTYTSRSAEVLFNELYKINSNRLIFVTKGNKLYFYLFDFYDNYSKIIVNIFNYGYTNYNLTTDMTLYYFNDYIYFTGTRVTDSYTFSFLSAMEWGRIRLFAATRHGSL